MNEPDHLPSELIPNELTVETLVKSQRGEEVHYAESIEDLSAQLGI